MKTAVNTGRYIPGEDYKTALTFDTSDNLWHAWSSYPEHIEKMIGSQWELLKVDAEGASFTAPERALQICVASGKKLTGKALRERKSSLYRAQTNAIVERRHTERNGN